MSANWGGINVIDSSETSRPGALLDARWEQNLRIHSKQILPFLKDPLTLDVCVNADGSCWVNRLGQGFAKELYVHRSSSRLLLNSIATVQGLELNHQHPILQTVFPLTGDRIEAIVSPVVDGSIFAIRTRAKQIYTFEDMKTAGIMTDKSDPLNRKRNVDGFIEAARTAADHFDVLTLATKFRRNHLIVGPTGSGKTTLGNSVIEASMRLTPNDRMVIIEDTPELQCSLPNHVQLLATSQVSQNDLLVASLRLRPDRLIVGEIRESGPAQVLLSAWNTGHSGGIATIHADDSLSALRKLETLIGGDYRLVRERIAASVNIVVFIDAEPSVPAGRKIREVLAITGYNSETHDYVTEYL